MSETRTVYNQVNLKALKEKFEHYVSLTGFLMFDAATLEEPDDEETERLLKAMCSDLKNMSEQLPKLI